MNKKFLQTLSLSTVLLWGIDGKADTAQLLCETHPISGNYYTTPDCKCSSAYAPVAACNITCTCGNKTTTVTIGQPFDGAVCVQSDKTLKLFPGTLTCPK